MIFRFSHLLVVVIGFGGAFIADFMVLSRLGGRVVDALNSYLHFAHILVWNSLVTMCLTGAIMIFLRTGLQFDDFSPKLFSQLIAVSVLTACVVMALP